MPTREELRKEYKPINRHKEVPYVGSGRGILDLLPVFLTLHALLISAAATSSQVPGQQEPELHRSLRRYTPHNPHSTDAPPSKS